MATDVSSWDPAKLNRWIRVVTLLAVACALLLVMQVARLALAWPLPDTQAGRSQLVGSALGILGMLCVLPGALYNRHRLIRRLRNLSLQGGSHPASELRAGSH